MSEIYKPNPNSPDYWPMRRDAFRAINRIHDLQERADKSPQYYASGYDQDGEPQDIIENTQPYDDVERTLKAALSTNPFVKETLEAWGVKVSQRHPDDPPYLFNKKGQFATAKNIPVFGREAKRVNLKIS